MQLVLIVEDDVLFRAAMARALGKLPSIEVIEAGGVTEATQLIRNLRIDLMLSDIELRDGTVLEILPQLEDRRIPAVLVSGHVAEFAERLPSGLEVHAKPVSPVRLCQLVTTKLGCADVRSPFSLADYLQLASMGQHSVMLEVASGGEPLGAIVVERGEAWSASDALGEGLDAFLRLMSDPEATTSCAPAPGVLGTRNLTGSCQHLLLDTVRLLDERRAGRLARPVAGSTPPAPRRPQPSLPPIPPPEGTRPTRQEPRPPDPNTEFDRLYGLGIEALLTKRYHDAFDTLLRASQIRMTASLEANLKRLRQMGFK
jgi:CheY-like chemotaxis protein